MPVPSEAELTQVGTLLGQGGQAVAVQYCRDYPTFASPGAPDVLLFPDEDGFSPLGSARSRLASALAIPESEIADLAHWNRFENPQVTVIALASRRSEGLPRGICLCPAEWSRCYLDFGTPRHGRPYRDFYYNVAYEALRIALQDWRATRIGISTFVRDRHEDVVTCQIEALGHLLDSAPQSNLASVTFHACGSLELGQMAALGRLHADEPHTRHRPIDVREERRGEARLLHLRWTVPEGHRGIGGD